MNDVPDYLRALVARFSDELVRIVELEVIRNRRDPVSTRIAPSKGRLRTTPKTVLRAIRLNGETCTAEFPNGPVRLTRVEFKLLRHLIANADRIVPYKELMETVVGRKYAPESALLRVHLLKLRRRLGAWSGLVETVHGRGVRIDESLVTGAKGRTLQDNRSGERSSLGGSVGLPVETTSFPSKRSRSRRIVLSRATPGAARIQHHPKISPHR